MFSPSLAIAVDAMGGDHAPQSEVEGALLAASELGLGIVLVGPESVLCSELDRRGGNTCRPVRVVHASEVITMHERAARAVRRKRDSSIRVAMQLMRDGQVQGVVSAGNTGAVMATAKLTLGTLPSVARPALAAIFPAPAGKKTVLIDVGANVDCKPEQLRQFGVMGATFARLVLNIPNPRVGLLSIGAEQSKGNELTREAYLLLKSSTLNFVGNVEGRDLYSGTVDVVVCDGFTGNVALKISEGLAETMLQLLHEATEETLIPAMRDDGWRFVLERFSKRVDYSETGGAHLLGVRGVCTICHGSSTPQAIKNAIRLAAEFAYAGMSEKIEAELARREQGSRAPVSWISN